MNKVRIEISPIPTIEQGIVAMANFLFISQTGGEVQIRVHSQDSQDLVTALLDLGYLGFTSIRQDNTNLRIVSEGCKKNAFYESIAGSEKVLTPPCGRQFRIMNSEGGPTYAFWSAVEDATFGVTHIIDSSRFRDANHEHKFIWNKYFPEYPQPEIHYIRPIGSALGHNVFNNPIFFRVTPLIRLVDRFGVSATQNCLYHLLCKKVGNFGLFPSYRHIFDLNKMPHKEAFIDTNLLEKMRDYHHVTRDNRVRVN